MWPTQHNPPEPIALFANDFARAVRPFPTLPTIFAKVLPPKSGKITTSKTIDTVSKIDTAVANNHFVIRAVI